MSEPPGEVTVLLAALRGGDRDVLDRLMPVVYGELREVARRALRSESPGHTLDTTSLVHEAYLRLTKAEHLAWRDRAHFFSVCAQAMRRVLVDHARRQLSAKRGGRSLHLPMDDVVCAARERPDDLLWVNEALERLERLSPRRTRVVECRVFAGMGPRATAEALGVSEATVKRDWAFARAWLTREAFR